MGIKAKLRSLIEIDKGPLSTECWLWVGARNNGGYGYMAYKGWSEGVHRVSWITNRGPIPNGIYVCHHCDTPNCFRPDHLFLGTPQDNVADMIAKGRHWFRAKARVEMGNG